MSSTTVEKGEPHIIYKKAGDLPPEQAGLIDRGLDAHDISVTGAERENFYVMAYERDSVIGGLRVRLGGQNFYIKHLWIGEEYRRSGIGSSLMKQAEHEAQRRGCKNIWVDTMGYRAPDFYRKLGYREAARVENYFDEHDRIFFRKAV